MSPKTVSVLKVVVLAVAASLGGLVSQHVFPSLDGVFTAIAGGLTGWVLPFLSGGKKDA